MEKDKEFRIPERAAFWAAIVSGMAAHAFGLVNILHNYDNILQQPKGFGAGVTSGRWLLTVLGEFCQNTLDLGYNMPVPKGLAFLLMIAISSALIVRTLGIHKKCSAVLTGCVMATFPTVCATMVFRFTAPYYGVSLLLAVVAVWILDRPKWGLLASSFCIACSMGIYQAYVPFSIGLFVLILMRQALQEDRNLRQLICRGLRSCVCLLLGLILYFVFLKITLTAYNAELDSYQGIDSMGKLAVSQLPGLVRKAWLSAALFSVRDYCTLASTPILKALWTLLIGVTLVLSLALVVMRKKNVWNVIFFSLMGILFPLAVNFIVVMAPDGIVYTIMVYSFVLVAVAPLMLLELLPEQKKKAFFTRFIAVIAALIVFYNGYYTNLNYTSLYYANRQVENYFSGLFTQMRMTDGYTPEKTWAFLGNTIQDPQFYSIWKVEPIYGGFIGSHAEGLLNASYSFDTWIHNYIGYETRYADSEAEQKLIKDSRVMAMPCWPSEGSIRVVDDYLVVKFQEVDDEMHN